MLLFSPDRIPVFAALQSPRRLPPDLHRWWGFQPHPASAPVGPRYPPRSSTPEEGEIPRFYFKPVCSGATLETHGLQQTWGFKPAAFFEQRLPVPEPVAATLWLWLPAEASHPLDTGVILIYTGTDAAQKPGETRGSSGASGPERETGFKTERGREGKRSQRRSDEYDKQQWTVWTSLPQVCSLVFRSLFWTFFFLHNHQEVSSHLKCEETCSLTLSFCWLLKKLLKAQWDTCCLQRTSWSWPRLWTWLICLSFMHSSPTSRRWVIPWSQAQDACCSLAFSPGLSLRCRPRTHRWDVRGGWRDGGGQGLQSLRRIALSSETQSP